MSNYDDYDLDDSLDDILANITISQLDPNKCDSNEQIKAKSVQTQTQFNYNNNEIKTKRRLNVIKTVKHNHMTCFHHKSHDKDGKKFKTNCENDFIDTNNENVNQIIDNECLDRAKSSSQDVLISNRDIEELCDFEGQQTQIDSQNTIEYDLSQKSINLLNHSNLMFSDSDKSSDDSIDILETDDESDGHRSPLHQLVINDSNSDHSLRSSQPDLITNEDLFNNSQNSNLSQNSIYSF